MRPVDTLGGSGTVRVGLIGSGIQLSRTPAMHEAEGARHGLDYRYELFDTDRMGSDPPSLETLIADAERRGFAGLNITYPFKQAAMAHLARLSEAAKAVGSVNTIVFNDGVRSGDNTDVSGFAQSFREDMRDAERETVLLLGAGGAGCAVASALLQCGVQRLLIADISQQRAHLLAQGLSDAHFGPASLRPDVEVVRDVKGSTASLSGIVNATPVGMAKLPGCPFPIEQLSADMWVMDIIYFPLETALLRAARELGCRALSGAGMAVYQAMHAFERFTGIPAEHAHMKASFDAFDSL